MAARDTDAALRGRRPPADGAQLKVAINIVGAGRLGTALALALASRGHFIQAVVSRRLHRAQRASNLIARHTRSLSMSQLDLLPPADVLFITTPDDAIATTARRIAASLAASTPVRNRRRNVALHTSGALSSAALQPLRDVGFRTGSMHPLISVSEPATGSERLQKAFYCVEGEPAAVRTARSIVRDLGGQSFSIGTRHKALYHAAAVMASGHMVALFDIAAEMLSHCGLTKRRARAVLMPLVESTLGNLSLVEPARALTGTFARADSVTVRNHLDALHQLTSHDPLAIYKLLGQRSLQLARKSGADLKALKQIERALTDGVEKSRSRAKRVRRPAR